MAGQTRGGGRQWRAARVTFFVGAALLTVPRFGACASPPTPTTTQAVVSSGLLTLTAAIDRRVPEGQPAVLTLALHNSGLKPLRVGGSANEASSFNFAVTDDRGHSAAKTVSGEWALTPPMSVSVNELVSVEPGQTLRYRFNLARLFDLSRAGLYTVRVSRTVNHTVLSAGPLKVYLSEAVTGYSGPEARTDLPKSSTFLYTFYQTSQTHDVRTFRVSSDGSVFPTLNVPVAVEQGTGYVTATPDGRFLYVGGEKTIAQFRVGENGVLSPLTPPTVASPQKIPELLLMDPKGRFLYTVTGVGYGLYSVGKDGGLTLTTQGSEPSGYSVLDATGNLLYSCASGTTGYRLGADGRVMAVLGTERVLAQKLPNGLTLGEQDTAVALTPSCHFAYVLASRGVGPPDDPSARVEDVVMPMRVDENANLVPLPGIMVPHDQNGNSYGSLSLTVDPTGHVLLVLTMNFIAPYRIERNGTLRALKSVPVSGQPSALFFVPGSPFLYVSSADGLRAYQVDAQNGLTPAPVDLLASGSPVAKNFAAAIALTPPEFGPVMDGLQLSVWTAGDVQAVGEPVVLTVTLKNTTAKPLFLGTVGADMAAFHLSLTGPPAPYSWMRGPNDKPVDNTVPLLAAGRDLLNTAHKNNTPLILPTGGTRQYRFVLSRLADLTAGGAYTMQVTRTLPNGKSAASPIVPFMLNDPSQATRYAGKEWVLQVP